MSFIAKSLYSYFFPNKNKKIPTQNIFKKNIANKLQNIYKPKKVTKEAKIFSKSNKETEVKQKPDIFSFINKNNQREINNNYLSDNYSKKNFFNDYSNKRINYYKNKDSSLGINFYGIGNIISDNQNCIFMSINALPEFSYSSNEELRLADSERLLTGNLKFYKIKNTSKESNNFMEESNNFFEENTNNYCLNQNLNEGNNEGNKLFNNDMLFKKQNILFSNDKINLSQNNENNIFDKEIGDLKSPFADLINNNNFLNTNYNQNHENNYFSFNNNFFNKNEINNNNNKNFFSFNKIPKQNKNIKYSFPCKSFSSINENLNISTNSQKFDINNSFNYNKISNEETSYPLNDNYINKLFSQKEKLSKALNEAIQKEKSVKEFLIDLDNEYNENESKSNENINSKDILNNFNYEDKKVDNGISLSQQDFNYKNNLANLITMKFTKEIPFYKMELDLNENKEQISNYKNSCSKIRQIYNDYERIKNNFNKTNFLGNKTYKKDYENFDSNKRPKLENIENNFSKTFSNGFPKLNSQNIQNGILFGRNEDLYKKNLMEIEKLSLNNINNINDNKVNSIFEKKNKNNLLIKNKEENYSLNNDNLSNKSLSISNISLRDSVSTISRKFVDLIIEYNLPERDNKYKKLYLYDINQLMKVKSLKEKIISEINNDNNTFLNTTYPNNYSISKISLLVPTDFLKDEDYLINYHLRSNNYTIQAIISYIKNNNNLAPKLDKQGYECIPSIFDLKNKTSEELKKINNFKIYNKYGEVEFKEPISLLGVNLNDEVIIEKNMIDTKDKLNYWSVFKLYDFEGDEGNISNFINFLNENDGKFISYKNKELIWEYKPKAKH